MKVFLSRKIFLFIIAIAFIFSIAPQISDAQSTFVDGHSEGNFTSKNFISPVPPQVKKYTPGEEYYFNVDLDIYYCTNIPINAYLWVTEPQATSVTIDDIEQQGLWANGGQVPVTIHRQQQCRRACGKSFSSSSSASEGPYNAPTEPGLYNVWHYMSVAIPSPERVYGVNNTLFYIGYITIEVEDPESNHPPTVNNVTIEVKEGVLNTGQLTGDDGDGDTLTFTVANGQDAELGTLNISEDGSFTYLAPSFQPTAMKSNAFLSNISSVFSAIAGKFGFNKSVNKITQSTQLGVEVGSDSFGYQASDGENVSNIGTATLVIIRGDINTGTPDPGGPGGNGGDGPGGNGGGPGNGGGNVEGEGNTKITSFTISPQIVNPNETCSIQFSADEAAKCEVFSSLDSIFNENPPISFW